MSEGRSSVLIVDDHPLVREGLSRLISQESDLWVCAEAASGAEALELAARLLPDLAIIDISLRGESGLDLVKALGLSSPCPRMLVLSMHEEVHYAERALRAGALGYVMKRESSGHVVAALRAIAAGKLYVSEAMAGLAADRLLRRGGEASDPAHRLSDRELEVFRLLGRGRENRQIAEELGLSLKTVQAHCANIKEKLGIENGTLLLRDAVRWVESNE